MKRPTKLISGSLTLAIIALALSTKFVHGDPLVPGLMIFGDSVVDAGNNNYIYTVVKANFLPYGRDFENHKPTGRFCNGKLATDYTADFLGFTSYPPPYLSPEAKGDRLKNGANFASGGSGYYDRTATLYRTLSLPTQLRNYKEYQAKMVDMIGEEKANALFSGSIHLLSAGSSDFVQNYYINPALRGFYTVDRFSSLLMNSYTNFVQRLYEMGARRIGVTNLPPLGCLPASITMFGRGSNNCVERLNDDAKLFNAKLESTSQSLKSSLPDLKLVVFDIFQPLLDMSTKPTQNGFFESRRACCGTGILETSLLCNARSFGTCTNATGYVFWDGYHPSGSANEVMAGFLLQQGVDLLS